LTKQVSELNKSVCLNLCVHTCVCMYAHTHMCVCRACRKGWGTFLSTTATWHTPVCSNCYRSHSSHPTQQITFTSLWHQ